MRVLHLGFFAGEKGEQKRVECSGNVYEEKKWSLLFSKVCCCALGGDAGMANAVRFCEPGDTDGVVWKRKEGKQLREY